MKKIVGGGIAAVAVATGIAVSPAGPANAEATFDMCPSGLSGVVSGTPTSCPFADNVESAFFSSGGNHVVAYSPVTHLWYPMTCMPGYIAHFADGESRVATECFGGIGAAVVVW